MLAGYLAGTVLPGFHATVLRQRFGPIDTVLTGAGVLILLGGIYALMALPATPQDAAANAGTA